jgi:hypothetical protein
VIEVTTSRTTKEYSFFELVFGNLAIILWISLGAISVGLFNTLVAVGYFLIVAFLIFYEMGKHGCVTCYYCKTCTIGMGKLPELFFRKKGNSNVNKAAMRLFLLVYILLSVLPVALITYLLFQELSILKVFLLTAILIFSLITGAARLRIWRFQLF